MGSRDHTRREHQLSERPLITNNILVATEGKPSQDAIVRVAAALAERHGAALRVVSVVPPAASYTGVVTDLGLVQAIRPKDDFQKNARLAVVGEQLRRLQLEQWTVTVLSGWPAIQIAAAARRFESSLIVMGIGRHLALDCLFGAETTLHVVRWATVPVMAVAGVGLLHRAIAAIDFDQASAGAARMAATLLSTEGILDLVHVRTPKEASAAASGRPPAQTNDPRLDDLARSFADAHPHRIETQLLHGDPTEALLAYSDASGADLIALGATRHSRTEYFLGTVTERVLRGARCSVIVTPASVVPFRSRGLSTSRSRRTPVLVE